MDASKHRSLTDFFQPRSSSIKRNLVNETTSGDDDPPKKRTKKFQSQWPKEFSWLQRGEHDTMTCSVCIDGKSSGQFTEGCSNFQRSVLVRHQESKPHKAALSTIAGRRYMAAAQKIVKEKHNDTLIAQLKTAMFMARENIPDRKFKSLVDLQLSNGATAFHSDSGKGKIYTSHHAVSDMQKALATIAKEQVIAAVQASPFIGLIFDESLDVAINKKLVMYCKVMCQGTVKISFCGNVVVKDGKADTIFDTVSQFLTDNNIPMCKVSGIGTDGAAVMTGKKGGVGKRFVEVNPNIVHIWCSAHRLALVSFWAAKNVPSLDLQNIQQVLTEIYNYFHYSAQRYNRIKDMQNVMNSHVKRFKKPSSVRWLSLYDAVTVVHDTWSALVLSMEHDANDKDPITSTKAKGFLKKLKSFSFISTLSVLKDILSHLTRASKYFQRDVLDVGQVQMMISSLKSLMEDLYELEHTPTVQDFLQQNSAGNAYCGIQLTVTENMKIHAKNVKNTFLSNIIKELDTRFDKQTMHVLTHMNTILDPSQLPQCAAGIQSHGRDELENILDFFDGRLNNSDDARDSFLQYKYMMNVNRNKSVLEFCTLLDKDMQATFPFYATLAEFFITVPLTSVPCERGFSNQNRIHTYARNRMKPESLENKMFLSQACSSSNYDEAEFLHLAKEKFKP